MEDGILLTEGRKAAVLRRRPARIAAAAASSADRRLESLSGFGKEMATVLRLQPDPEEARRLLLEMPPEKFDAFNGPNDVHSHFERRTLRLANQILHGAHADFCLYEDLPRSAADPVPQEMRGSLARGFAERVPGRDDIGPLFAPGTAEALRDGIARSSDAVPTPGSLDAQAHDRLEVCRRPIGAELAARHPGWSKKVLGDITALRTHEAQAIEAAVPHPPAPADRKLARAEDAR